MKKTLVRARRPPARRAGFTLAETAVVLAISALLMTLGIPPLLSYLSRSKMDGAARQTAQLFQLARLESIKRSLPVRVAQDFTADSVFAWIDMDRSGGSFNVAVDLMLGQPFPLPPGLSWHGPGDTGNDRSNGSWNFPEGAFGAGIATFQPDGSMDAVGAFRMTDGKSNYLEIRVENSRTAKTAIQKYFGDPLVETDEVNWYENGEAGHDWTWN